MYMYMYMYAHVCLYIYMNVRMYMCVHVYTYIHVHVYTCMYIIICMYVHLHVYMCTYNVHVCAMSAGGVTLSGQAGGYEDVSQTVPDEVLRGVWGIPPHPLSQSHSVYSQITSCPLIPTVMYVCNIELCTLTLWGP